MNEKNNYNELFEKIKQLNIDYQKPEQNFLSITNFPRYENVISDILAFYFNTEEQHCLKDLWVMSLLKCYKKYNDTKDVDFSLITTQEVIREQSTDERKRIDLYLRTEQNIIIIENKIDSSPSNSWKSYFDKAKQYYLENAENNSDIDKIENKIIPILLTVKNEKEAQIDNFINITYEELFNKVRENIGFYLSNASEKWLIYMNEFMKNIDDINKGYQMNSINDNVQELLENNTQDIENLLNVLKDDSNAKVDYIKSTFEEFKQLNNRNFEIGTYNCYYDKLHGYLSMWINMKKGNDVIAIEPYVIRCTNRIRLEIWNRTKNDKNSNWNQEIEILKSDFESIKTDKDGGWGDVLLVKEYSFYSDPITPKEFAKILYKITEKLSAIYSNI